MLFEARNVVLVSRTAINPEDGREFVWLFEDGNRKKRYVVTGLFFENNVQVLSGLEPGEEVWLN
jgi:hypothetical protein